MTAVWSVQSVHAEGLDRVRRLEDVAIHLIREVSGQFERPALELGDDEASQALARLVDQAFWPARPPFRAVKRGEPLASYDAVLRVPADEWGHRAPSGVFAVGSINRARRDIWDVFNGRRRSGEQVQVLPLSNWSRADVAEYLQAGAISAP